MDPGELRAPGPARGFRLSAARKAAEARPQIQGYILPIEVSSLGGLSLNAFAAAIISSRTFSQCSALRTSSRVISALRQISSMASAAVRRKSTRSIVKTPFRNCPSFRAASRRALFRRVDGDTRGKELGTLASRHRRLDGQGCDPCTLAPWLCPCQSRRSRPMRRACPGWMYYAFGAGARMAMALSRSVASLSAAALAFLSTEAVL